ncbi:transporter substrate-binding domain-containing protein [Pseudomonas berkeleyensis]|uniref:Transporter substrate-binding domain-containing protein n=1 Tax=Pseudomonas berkeleyensis TaxID=2726956 RepID=A0A7G5DJS4_9PSED|nr:transporter substrate-binding domain-containing protein [Pseudomonas berkeleyensis]QMV61999.1 transporter substrate-binding domain-containing protein [Pseudomonas berkeleyensis]WSO37441.1 transporter substrate-binding domain-containing protein [Pseudomonas berkeleyensis]
MRLTLLLLIVILGSAHAADTVRLTNGEWPPYLGEDLPHHGVASRIVAEAFALQNVEVQWEFHPWARSLKMAEQGTRDGSAVWLYNREREQRFHISDPVVESGYYLFHRKNRHFDWSSVEDLRGLRIAATRGYDYGDAFQQAEAAGEIDVVRLTGDEQGLRQLLAGRVDLFPVDKVVGFDLLYQQFSAAERRLLSFHPVPLRSDSLHLLLSREVPGNAELMQRFNQSLARLRDSGKISQYLLEIQQPLSLGH